MYHSCWDLNFLRHDFFSKSNVSFKPKSKPNHGVLLNQNGSRDYPDNFFVHYPMVNVTIGGVFTSKLYIFHKRVTTLSTSSDMGPRILQSKIGATITPLGPYPIFGAKNASWVDLWTFLLFFVIFLVFYGSEFGT